MQRAAIPAAGDLALGLRGLGSRELRRDRDKGVEVRLDRGDAREARLGQLDRRDPPVANERGGILSIELIGRLDQGWRRFSGAGAPRVRIAKTAPRMMATTAPAINASSVPLPASGEMPKSSSIQSMTTSPDCCRIISSRGAARLLAGDGLHDERPQRDVDGHDADARRDVRGERAREGVGDVLLR
jgi:hypothetical protein